METVCVEFGGWRGEQGFSDLSSSILSFLSQTGHLNAGKFTRVGKHQGVRISPIGRPDEDFFLLVPCRPSQTTLPIQTEGFVG